MTSRRLLCIAACSAVFGIAGVASAQPAATLPLSKGYYRLPYGYDKWVDITNDHETHPPKNRLDMAAQGNGPHSIVAAADGVIEYIRDNNTMGSCTGQPGCANNYVWLRHSNGEWTKYTHMATGSVAAEGWLPGDFVQSGEKLGVEGDIGFASGPHLHFEVAVPNDPDNPINSAGFLVDDGDAGTTNYNRQNRIPVFCNGYIAGVGDEVKYDGPCSTNCIDAIDWNGITVGDGELWPTQVDDQVTASNFVVENGAGSTLRGGNRVVLEPGFHAETGSYFSASIGSCNSPGAP
jgi:hypothetical protein